MLRESGDGDFRQELADQFPFGRIVVQEDHAVQADIQFLGHLPDVGRLVLPVDPAGRKMFFPENHGRDSLPGFQDIGLIILRTDRQDDAGLFQFQQGFLEESECFARIITADHDSVQAVFPKDSAPKGIVQIQDDALFPLERHAVHLLPPPMDEIAGKPGIQSHLRDEIEFPIHQLRGRIPGCKVAEIDDFQVRMLLSKAIERQIEPGDGCGKLEITLRYHRFKDRNQRQGDKRFRRVNPPQEVLHLPGIALYFLRQQFPVVLNGDLIEPDIPFRILRDERYVIISRKGIAFREKPFHRMISEYEHVLCPRMKC